MSDNIANRYALALLSIAKEEHLVEEYRLVVKEINQSLKENQVFIEVLSSAFIENEVKYKIIDDILVGVEYPHILSWIKIIVDNHREDELEQILEVFNTKCLNYRDVKQGIVYSVFALTDKQLEKLEAAIGEVQDCEVELKNIIDATLLGGIKIVIGDSIYDGTALNRLDAIKNKLC